MKKKKVLFFVQGNVGGAEKITLRISKSLDKNEYEIKYILFSMNPSNDYPLESLLSETDLIIRIPRLSTCHYLYAFYKIIKSEKPNIVFASTFFIAAKLLLLKFFFRNTKFIIRCEHNPSKFSGKQIRIIKKTYNKADIIIAQTEEMHYELCSLLKRHNNIITLSNPISPSILNSANEFLPYSNLIHPIFVAVGRFNYVKGFDILIEAFHKYIENYKRGTLCIVGDYTENKSYYQQVHDLVGKYNLKDFVYFPGFKLNPYPYIKCADCFVLSSRSEGLPNVMLESLYLGTPVAAFSCVPVVQSIIRESVNGYIAEKENPYALAEAMFYSIKLGRIHPTYETSTIDDFKALF